MKRRVFLYLLFCIFSLSAQQTKKVNDLKKEQLAIAADIAETNRLLSENTKTTSNALNRLNLLTQMIDSRKKMILLLNRDIISLDEEINNKELEINTLENDLESKKQLYATSLRKMYLHKKNQDNLLFILSSQNFTQSFHRIIYLKTFSGWQKKQAEEIIEKQKTVAQEKKTLIAYRNDKLTLLKNRQTEETQLNKEEESKKAEIKELEENKKALQADLAKKEKQANDLDQQIRKIIAQQVLRSYTVPKPGRDKEKPIPEETGGYAMTKSERNLASTFAGSKGKLPFPLTGSYKVVGYFGIHRHKELTRIETNNNGINIETTPGNEARAVFDGVVSEVFTARGYNFCIIIRHGNYLTLYSNIDKVYVKQGDTVSTGQAIGRIYTDKENGNSTLLHFEIWKELKKLNPSAWIR